MAKPKLGDRVIYRAAEMHHTTTVKSGEELKGSTHHAEMMEFAAHVGRVHADGTADLQLLIPGKPPVWIERIKAGKGPGTFSAQDD
jgi:hypothetical protein